jgi:hypothetical protein
VTDEAKEEELAAIYAETQQANSCAGWIMLVLSGIDWVVPIIGWIAAPRFPLFWHHCGYRNRKQPQIFGSYPQCRGVQKELEQGTPTPKRSERYGHSLPELWRHRKR